MLITPSTTDIEDIIRNLLSWVPNNFKLEIVRNAIDEDIIDTFREEIKEEVYNDIREEALYDYVHYTDVKYKAEELAEEMCKEEKQQYEEKIKELENRVEALTKEAQHYYDKYENANLRLP